MVESPFATLFYNLSSSFFLVFIFFHFTSIFLANLFFFIGANPFSHRTPDGYEFEDEMPDQVPSEGEEDDRFYGVKKVEDCFYGVKTDEDSDEVEDESSEEQGIKTDEDSDEVEDESSEVVSLEDSDESGYQTGEGEENVEIEEEIVGADSDCENHDPTSEFAPEILNKEDDLAEEKNEDVFGESFTIGSTSKDSSEWRSSINCGTDDPFSSSSRRSCPKWESYTVFQKYDEEMLFLDGIAAQKLHETESLRSIQACPRSISERIVRKFGIKSSKLSRHNPYHELEAAYVAQICLTWEALNWNYTSFQRLRASRKHFDPGCPAYIAQQFQQFQVLLQRYIENEPYEHGRRPEIYARMRTLAPKLLQVPQYRDCDDEKREDSSRIPSTSFVDIMEESIRTFMNFLKRDKKNHYQMLADLFKRNTRGSPHATLLHLLRKLNKKKKAKVKELRHKGSCLRKRRMEKEEEMEMVMAETDLRVVSRVLRASDLNGEQLHWCEAKMAKLRLSHGKLQRDSLPLFFPAH